MKQRPPSEEELLRGLNEHTSHADEVFEPLPQEVSPLERLTGPVTKYEQPLATAWDDWFDDTGVSEDDMADRDQPEPKD